MSQSINKCPSCNTYTLEKICSKCGVDTLLPRPPKFSLNDKYAQYRREVKKSEWVLP